MTPEKKTPKAKTTRRTPEQRIADLQAEIEAVKQREAAKAVRSSAEGKAFLAAAKAVDAALTVALAKKDEAMAYALGGAQSALEEHIIETGMPLPAARVKPRAVPAK